MEENKKKFPSELRLDLASKDWVIIATGRARKPETFKKEKKAVKTVPKKDCPFCNIHTQEKPVLILKNKEIVKEDKIPKNWTTIVIPNKYPAFMSGESSNERFEGPLYQAMDAVGFHELIITSDHQKDISRLPLPRIKEVFEAYQQRYLVLKGNRFVNYISIFHNHGQGAGASIYHPHSQIITSPLIDVDIRNGLSNAENYFNLYNICVYCQMSKWEMEVKERIVFENENFLVLCPFASKSAFEVIISPKKHLSYFENITEKEKEDLVEAFHIALRKINKALNFPDYNFYLHTAPCDGQKHDYYHWHWTILPKTSTWAGFEIGTGMEISTIEPEKAAEYLRKQKI